MTARCRGTARSGRRPDVLNSQVNLRQLECFLAVADELHFGRAARRLFLSSASVSEMVAALEHRLGGRLFDRSTRRVQLTPFGAEFLVDVRGPYEQLVRAHHDARTRARLPGRLVLAHTPELGHLLLPPLLSALPAGTDDSSAWRPVLMHTPEQLRALEEGRADIGLCWSATVRPSLVSTVLGTFPVVAAIRANDPLATEAEIRLSDLRTRHLLTTPREDNPFLSAQLQAHFMDAGVPEANVEEVNRYDELVVHVAGGSGVGLHAGTIAVMNRIPGVVFRRITEPRWSVTICALRRSTPPPGVETVLTALAGIVAEIDLSTALPQ